MFTSSYAWFALTDEQKERLEKERRAGRAEFGGLGNKAPYLWVQERSKPQYEEGAMRAGKKDSHTHFIANALDVARGQIPSIIQETISN